MSSMPPIGFLYLFKVDPILCIVTSSEKRIHPGRVGEAHSRETNDNFLFLGLNMLMSKLFSTTLVHYNSHRGFRVYPSIRSKRVKRDSR